jgi:hypothetical protein
MQAKRWTMQAVRIARAAVLVMSAVRDREVCSIAS